MRHGGNGGSPSGKSHHHGLRIPHLRELREKEYETATANERLYDFLYGKSYGQDDFYHYRATLE